MKKIISSTVALMFVASLTLVTTAAAARWNSDETKALEPVVHFSPSEQSGPDRLASSEARGSDYLVRWHSDEAPPIRPVVWLAASQRSGAEFTLAGTISNAAGFRWNSDERFPSDSVIFQNAGGETFGLASNAKSLELSTLSGKSVEIKGTVMEGAGHKVIEVSDYSVLE